jgi:WD40 repeat protein
VAPIYDGPSLSCSPDGHRVILCRGIGGNYVFLDNRGNYTDRVAIWVGGIGQTVVLNADTGEPLPPLEGGEYLDTFAGSQAFSEDGRFLALSGQCFTRIKEAGKDLAPNLVLLEREPKPFLTVWDTKTGKTLTSWDRSVTALAFNPRRPLLAVLEPNDTETRLGLWDFTAEMADEK